jgi:hypothetical protein
VIRSRVASFRPDDQLSTPRMREHVAFGPATSVCANALDDRVMTALDHSRPHQSGVPCAWYSIRANDQHHESPTGGKPNEKRFGASIGENVIKQVASDIDDVDPASSQHGVRLLPGFFAGDQAVYIAAARSTFTEAIPVVLDMGTDNLALLHDVGPTMLIGTSTQPAAFSEQIAKQMASNK